MAATTVRVEERVKREFDRLQRRLRAAAGRRVSHSELLARLVRFARAHEEAFLGDGDEPSAPPTRADLERIFARVRDWGVATDVTKLDRVLYGGRSR